MVSIGQRVLGICKIIKNSPQTRTSSIFTYQDSMSFTIMENGKHLNAESEYPQLSPNKLRVYNMKYCPYAQRTLLVILYKRLKNVELVNINLKNRPSWFLDLNPMGKVPVLETEKGVVLESLITCDFLDSCYPDPPLFKKNVHQKFVDKSFIALFDTKVITPLQKLYFRRDLTSKFDEWTTQLQEGLDIFEKELNKRGTPCFGGSKPGMLDYMIWPWFERFPVFSALLSFDLLSDSRCPCLASFSSFMVEDEVVKATLLTTDNHLQFITGLLQGQPEYDADTPNARL